MPLCTSTPVCPTAHRLSKVVDEIVHLAECESLPSRVLTEVVALVFRLKEGVVGPGQLVNLREARWQDGLGCLRSRGPG